MRGQLISNEELSDLVARRQIDIKPFEPERAQVAHYPLDPEAFYGAAIDGKPGELLHTFRTSDKPFLLPANQYVVVEVRQHVAPGVGFVGLFVPSSNLIESGISLTAGKISYPFGQRNERLRFGLRNNLSMPVKIGPEHLVAYVQFFDLTDSPVRPYALSDRDVSVYQARKHIADDDGVWALPHDEPDAPV
jgi:deoxycytidine triphosphate deaminase